MSDPITQIRCPGCGSLLSGSGDTCDNCAMIAQTDLYTEARRNVERRDSLGREPKATNTKSADGYWVVCNQLRLLRREQLDLGSSQRKLTELMTAALEDKNDTAWLKLRRERNAMAKALDAAGKQIGAASKEQREWQLASGRVMEKWSLEEQEEYFLKLFRKMPMPRMRSFIARLTEEHNQVITRVSLRKGLQTPRDLKAVK